MAPGELDQELAKMKALGIFRYKVPGSSTEYTDWLCATHREPSESWHWCDACKAPLYFSDAGSPHTRVTDNRDEAAEHGYGDILDRPPFELDVELCPACHDSVEHRRSDSCPGCDQCSWKSDSPLHQYDRDEAKGNERVDDELDDDADWDLSPRQNSELDDEALHRTLGPHGFDSLTW